MIWSVFECPWNLPCRCLIRKEFTAAAYITMMALPWLMLLFNSCMLGLVVFRLWALRKRCEAGWEKVNAENRSRLWKDCATVLGLSWVLGLPWALLNITSSLVGMFVFTILNSLQGQCLCVRVCRCMCVRERDNNKTVHFAPTIFWMSHLFFLLSGVFMFLWSVALSCKSRSEENSPSRDPSSQKIMTTSFNNWICIRV